MTTSKKDAAAKKRSEASKKAAATRKKNQAAEEQETEKTEKSTVEPYKPSRLPLQNAGLDQALAEDQRQAELDEERQVHNERTGDASLR
jgi:hypothetical protein